MRVIGLDPGLRNTGWGVIDAKGNNLVFVAAGTISSDPKADLANRLLRLYDGLADIVSTYAPQEAAVESLFVNRDASATLKLGQARAIALLVPAKAGLKVAEYAPNKVKKSLVGAGHGGKEQVQHMVKMLLPKADYDSADAADGLALAICHAHHKSF